MNMQWMRKMIDQAEDIHPCRSLCDERKWTEEPLFQLYNELEQRLADRTVELTEKAEDLNPSRQALQYLFADVNQANKELEIKIAEIERTYRIFVRRELHMLELKKRIKEMEQNRHGSVGTDPGCRS